MTDNNGNNPKHRKLAVKLLITVIGMFGFGYALVPMYSLICDATGLNGKTGEVSLSEAQKQAIDKSRTITLKLTASVNAGVPMDFRPDDTTMQVHPGGIYRTTFMAHNKAPHMLIGQAVPSMVPREASLYFKKTECFCFTQQQFKAGETRDMPVQFIVDRDIPKYIDSMVLSYTFYDITQAKHPS